MKKLDIKEFSLTPKQTELARLIVKGLPRKNMADRQKVSITTIDSHLKIIRLKLNVSSIYEASALLSHYF